MFAGNAGLFVYESETDATVIVHFNAVIER